MNCMKCGRETVEGQVFCNACLEEMEKYPVKPGTLIRLPCHREEPALKKNHVRKRNPPSPEEQIKSLKKTVRRLIAAVLLLIALLAVSGYFAVIHLLENNGDFLIGQNYSAMNSSESTEVD